jgi:nuclear GTP-binding protein
MAKTKVAPGKRVPKDRINKSDHSMNPDRVGGGVGKNKRDRATVKRLQMYRNFKPKRDSTGHIVSPAPFQSRLTPGTVSRIEPNRRWFGNTRVITQSALQTFQDEMKKAMKDPYKVVMQQTKLPVSLLNEKAKNRRLHILEMESFEQTFGSKSRRKRPRIAETDMESLLKRAEESSEGYKATEDRDRVTDDPGFTAEASELIFKAGQSKRIWNELYKVIDSADVIAQVLDARDPQGTRSKHIEDYLRKEKPHKQLVFILNKVDLIPTFITEKWVAILSSEYPTMAFHASVKNPFGRGALINLLRQFGKLHTDKKQISVGFIGYPNVGKSSVINTLRAKKVCKVAPIAGETKVWQYVTLMRRIFLIDCPGVVYPVGDTETDTVLKGVVRVENIRNPEDHIAAVLERVEKHHLCATYSLTDWTSPEDFLEQIAYKAGRLLKGGQPDISTVARMVLNDWQRGKIPFYVRPPLDIQDTSRDSGIAHNAPLSENTDLSAEASEKQKSDDADLVPPLTNTVECDKPLCLVNGDKQATDSFVATASGTFAVKENEQSSV